MATDAQIAANQSNAQQSTGPVTPTGKAIVSHNALKHGILSQAIISEADSLKESPEEFDGIKQDLVETLEPMGMLEIMLVDRIAVCYWRLRRVVWAENGAIRLQLDNLWFREKGRLMDEAMAHKRFPGPTQYWDRMKNSVSARMAIEQLQELKKTLEEVGYLPDQAFKEYVNLKNLLENESLCAWLFHLNQMAQGKGKEETDRQKGKDALIALLDDDISRAITLMQTAEKMEGVDIEGKHLLMRIPSADASEKIMRYETAIENQLYKGMNQLIKLQTLRKGGKVVSVSTFEAESIDSQP